MASSIFHSIVRCEAYFNIILPDVDIQRLSQSRQSIVCQVRRISIISNWERLEELSKKVKFFTNIILREGFSIFWKISLKSTNWGLAFKLHLSMSNIVLHLSTELLRFKKSYCVETQNQISIVQYTNLFYPPGWTAMR